MEHREEEQLAQGHLDACVGYDQKGDTAALYELMGGQAMSNGILFDRRHEASSLLTGHRWTAGF